MGVFFLYASFPNSRNKPRPATTSAFTYQIPVLDTTQPLTLVAPATSNRTYIILKNLDQTNNFWYTYATTLLVSPAAVPTFGVVDQLAYDKTGQQLYQKQDVGTNTNWTPVNISDVGERVEPLQNANLESPQDIYAASDSAVPLVPDVLLGIDEGTG